MNTKRTGIFVWILFHVCILAIALCAVIRTGSISIDTDLFSVIPDSGMDPAVTQADKYLTTNSGRMATVLAEADDFAVAREAAFALRDALSGRDDFESLTLGIDGNLFMQITEFAKENKFLLLPQEDCALLEQSDGAEIFARRALANAYSGFSLTGGSDMDTDPFFLADSAITSFAQNIMRAGTSMAMHDDVLAAQYEGKWYVLLRAVLSVEGSALADDESGAARIFNEAARIESKMPGVHFYYSGVAFHSHEASTKASFEVTLISAIAMMLVSALLLFVFRDVRPILCTVGAIIVSCFTACCATVGVFGNIHFLTFVFGTTLIGTCVDYSIHYFVHGAVGRGMRLSLLSTLMCYIMLLLAPFTLLKQVAVFSISGLLSSYCSVQFLYTCIRKRFDTRIAIPQVHNETYKRQRRKILLALFALALICTAINYRKVGIHNDINNLYTMSDRMKRSEALCAKVINHGAAGWYFIIEGATQEEVAEHEAQFMAALKSSSDLATVSVGQYVPTVSQQKKSYHAAQALLPLAEQQFENLGFLPEEIPSLTEQYAADCNAEPEYISMGNNIPDEIASLCSSLWIGRIDGKWYTAVLPLHTTNADTVVDQYRALAAQYDFVHFISRVGDTSAALNRLSRLIFMLFGIAIVVIFFVLLFFYPCRTVIKICFVPLFVTATIIAVYAIIGQALEFFGVIGMILVFGLGLDYVIYVTESAERQTSVAVALSFATTLLSFGALMFSTFVPVHIFGLTVSIGLLAAFICSRLSSRF